MPNGSTGNQTRHVGPPPYIISHSILPCTVHISVLRAGLEDAEGRAKTKWIIVAGLDVIGEARPRLSRLKSAPGFKKSQGRGALLFPRARTIVRVRAQETKVQMPKCKEGSDPVIYTALQTTPQLTSPRLLRTFELFTPYEVHITPLLFYYI